MEDLRTKAIKVININNIVVMVYWILAGVMFTGLLVFILIIAGKDIYFAFKRRIIPKGNDVFVVDQNRQFSYYYMTPEKGVFTIDGDPYIANPDKILSLDEATKEKVEKAREKEEKKRQDIIKQLEKKKSKLMDMANKLKLKDPSEQQIELLEQCRSQYDNLDKRLKDLRDKKDKFEMYYYKRRGAFLFLRGDPVPKNLHEWFTDLDSTTLGNVIARAQTNDPRAIRNLELWLKRNQIIFYGLIIGMALALFLLFQMKGSIEQIAAVQGVVLEV